MWVLLLLGACGAPPAGSTRTDRDGLAERMIFATTATDLWWIARAANGRGGTPGRADAQIHAWLAVEPGARAELTEALGPTMGRSVLYLPSDLVERLVPEAERSSLPHNAEKKLYQLEGERFPPEGVARPGYRGQVVLLTGDRVYISLQAR